MKLRNPEGYKTRSRSETYSGVALKEQGLACIICGWALKSLRSCGVEVHHITPVADGGTNKQVNLAVLCPNHHAEAGAGLISRLELRAYRLRAIRRASSTLPTHLKDVVANLRYLPQTEV